MSKELRTITVLDFEKGKVFQHNLSDDSCWYNAGNESCEEYCEDFLIEQGYSLGNIQWMLHEDSTIYVK